MNSSPSLRIGVEKTPPAGTSYGSVIFSTERLCLLLDGIIILIIIVFVVISDSGNRSLFRGLIYDVSTTPRNWRGSDNRRPASRLLWRRFRLHFRGFQLFASRLGGRVGHQVKTAVSIITRLRKSEIAFVCVFRLISASRIFWRISTHSSYTWCLSLSLRFFRSRGEKGRRLSLW